MEWGKGHIFLEVEIFLRGLWLKWCPWEPRNEIRESSVDSVNPEELIKYPKAGQLGLSLILKTAETPNSHYSQIMQPLF